MERELLFNASLAHRAKLKAERLDESLKTATDWRKMFSNLTENIRYRPSVAPIEVLLSGEEWLLRDATGAAYTVVRDNDKVGVYLPDLKEAFDVNNVVLSTDLTISTQQTNSRWLITDKKNKQAYSIQSGKGKLHVYQQSKFEILTFLFDINSAFQSSLAKGQLPSALIQEFLKKNLFLSRRAQVLTGADGASWQISGSPVKYNIRSENNRLKVYLDLNSKWLQVKVNDDTRGWVQSERGTIFMPPPPTVSSRQQAKERLLVLINKLKDKVGIFND